MSLKGSWSESRDPFYLLGPNHISRVVKFCVYVDYIIKCYPWDDKLPLEGMWLGHATLFKNLGLQSYFEWVRHIECLHRVSEKKHPLILLAIS